MFKNDPEVSFGDINWSEENHFSRAFGTNFGPGDGGWPTIRFFNKATGYGGQPYKQKTEEDMDVELGKEDRMREYVEQKSGRSMCDVVWGEGCSAMEIKYINKWVGPDVQRDKAKIQAEKDRWVKDLASSTAPKNFAQNKQRIMILERILSKFSDPEL